MAQLLDLDQRLHGAKTVKAKKPKPEPRVCPICHEKVGVSAASLDVHFKHRHGPPDKAAGLGGSTTEAPP
jgi:hypothetical protein